MRSLYVVVAPEAEEGRAQPRVDDAEIRELTGINKSYSLRLDSRVLEQ